MRLRHKKWQEQMIEDNPSIALQKKDIEQVPAFTELEIGSGCGQFLINSAKRHPNKKYLGVEINRTAFAIAVKKLVNTEDKPENLYFLNAPIDDLFSHIPLNSLDNIYLNFSDPWPKVRHQKRRLTYPTRLITYLSLLKPQGKILFKTDNKELFDDSVEYFKSIEGLESSFDYDYKLQEDDCSTEYEDKFRAQGATIYRVVAVKK